MTQPREKSGSDYTYADYLTWPEDERWELIDGEAFDMTPAPTTRHQEVLLEIASQLKISLHGKPCRVFPAPVDVVFPSAARSEDSAKNVVQPDVIVVCDPAKIRDTGIFGAPDLVVEILSPSTSSKDHIRKKALYERNGVKEYWLVHPVERVVVAYRQAPPASGAKPSFGPAIIQAGSDFKLDVASIPGLSVDFSPIFPEEKRVVKESPAGYRARKREEKE